MAACIELDRILATASEWQGWTCWLYTTVGHRLVLRGENGPSWREPDNEAYLIVRRPQWVRLTWHLHGEPVQFARETPPTGHCGSNPDPGEVVRIRLEAGGQSYWVEGSDLELCTMPMQVPSARHLAVDYCYGADQIVRLYDEDADEELRQFLGEPFHTLEWSGLHVSHGQLRLLASGFPGGGVVELRCFGTSYLDLAATMTRPRLRLANPDECEALRAGLPANLISDTYPPRAALPYPLAAGEAPRPGDRLMKDGWVLRPAAHAGYLIIDCDEGRYHLLTAQVALRRLRRRTYTFSRYVSQSFWGADPPASEL